MTALRGGTGLERGDHADLMALIIEHERSQFKLGPHFCLFKHGLQYVTNTRDQGIELQFTRESVMDATYRSDGGRIRRTPPQSQDARRQLHSWLLDKSESQKTDTKQYWD